jgi:hypothetical protein
MYVLTKNVNHLFRENFTEYCSIMITKNFSGALQLTDLDDFIGPSQVFLFFLFFFGYFLFILAMYNTNATKTCGKC